jgi:hypothetical protein
MVRAGVRARASRVGRIATAVVVLAACVLFPVTNASASGGPPRFVGDPPTIGDFTGVTLNGTAQLSTAYMTPFVVLDDTNPAAGWNVSLLVPDFQNGTGADCSTGSTASIPASSLTMDAPAVVPADGGTSMTGVTPAGFADFTTSRIIVDAAAGDGTGTYDVSPPVLRLTVPSDALVGAYCTEATIAINSGP